MENMEKLKILRKELFVKAVIRGSLAGVCFGLGGYLFHEASKYDAFTELCDVAIQNES
jgi:hypothetical protein